MAQELVQILPYPEWAVHGYPESKEMYGLETLGLGCLIWVLSLVDYTLSGNYVIFSNLAITKFVMESWLNSHLHTHTHTHTHTQRNDTRMWT